MSKYDFDKIVDRRNTNSLKWDYAEKRNKPADILPLWVADMDFRAPDEVIDTLVKKAQHGIFGYSEPLDEYFDALEKWFNSHYGYKPDRNSFILSCGVVFALCNLIDTLTKENDAVLITQPVYYPFSEAITDNKRKLVINELIYKNGRYSFDYDDFENKIIENNVRLYLLCNPHNPVGRVWTLDELKKISEICLRYNVFVVSDEIHADFIYRKYKFTSYALLGEKALDNAVICTAPSKTFNLAGLHNANIYIPNRKIRYGYIKNQNAKGYSQSNIMGIVGCQAAYTYGEEWHKELLEYLEGNLNFLRDYINNNIPKIKLVEPEGTYLVWLDCKDLGLSDQELNNLIVYKAKLWLDAGNIFGKVGECFERINIATSRTILKEALDKLSNALKAEGVI